MGQNESVDQHQQDQNILSKPQSGRISRSRTRQTKRIKVIIPNRYSDQVDLIEVQIEDETLTCGWLYSEVIRKAQNRFLKAKQIVQLKTANGNITLDYWLSKWDRPLFPLIDGDLLKVVYYEDSDFQPLPTIHDFKPIKCIGRGGFSKVFLVRRKDTGKLYAMKTIKKQFIIEQNKVDQIKTERQILQKLNHPFLVSLKWAFQSKKELHFVLDFCPGGELFFHLHNIGKLTEDQARFYFGEILLGLEELHMQNIAYRDLKPENILLDLDGHIRLTDFGLSKLGVKQTTRSYSFCGSPEYMSPEMLKMQGHGRAVDFYSLGALLHEMLTGLPPFYSEDRNLMFMRIQSEDITLSQKLSPQARSLIKQLLIKDPEKRMGSLRGVEEIKEHSWCQPLDFKQLMLKKVMPPLRPNLRQNNFDPECLNLPVDLESINEDSQILQSSRTNNSFLQREYNELTASIRDFDFLEKFDNFEFVDQHEMIESNYIHIKNSFISTHKDKKSRITPKKIRNELEPQRKFSSDYIQADSQIFDAEAEERTRKIPSNEILDYLPFLNPQKVGRNKVLESQKSQQANLPTNNSKNSNFDPKKLKLNIEKIKKNKESQTQSTSNELKRHQIPFELDKAFTQFHLYKMNLSDSRPQISTAKQNQSKFKEEKSFSQREEDEMGAFQELTEKFAYAQTQIVDQHQLYHELNLRYSNSIKQPKSGQKEQNQIEVDNLIGKTPAIFQTKQSKMQFSPNEKNEPQKGLSMYPFQFDKQKSKSNNYFTYPERLGHSLKAQKQDIMLEQQKEAQTPDNNGKNLNESSFSSNSSRSCSSTLTLNNSRRKASRNSKANKQKQPNYHSDTSLIFKKRNLKSGQVMKKQPVIKIKNQRSSYKKISLEPDFYMKLQKEAQQQVQEQIISVPVTPIFKDNRSINAETKSQNQIIVQSEVIYRPLAFPGSNKTVRRTHN